MPSSSVGATLDSSSQRVKIQPPRHWPGLDLPTLIGYREHRAVLVDPGWTAEEDRLDALEPAGATLR